MKIVVFGPNQRVGALLDGNVIDLNKADPRLPSQLGEFIALGKPAIAKAKNVLDKPKRSAVLPMRGNKLHAPWAGKRVAMMGGNYADHLARMDANMHGEPFDDESVGKAHSEARRKGHWGFWKVLDRLAGPTDSVPFPKRTKYLDYEGEVAIVIGKRGKNIPANKIKDYVWGVTLVNDWSIRGDRGSGRILSYNLPKNFDGSCSMGPCILVGEVDCEDVDCETRINGELRQQFNTKDMIFSFGEVLEYLSQDFTFVPGDVIGGGTAKGTAADMTKNRPDGSKPTDLFLKKGDVVEVSSPQIGTIRNKLV